MDYKRFENLYFYSIDDKVGLADEQNKENLDELQPEEFNEEASTEEDTSIDYCLAYDRMKNKYLSDIRSYKKESLFIEPELSIYRELIKKYEDEKTFKNDFLTALEKFKKEADALKTKDQHSGVKREKRKQARKSFFNNIFDSIGTFFKYIGLGLWWVIKGPALGVWWLIKGIGFVLYYLFLYAFEDDDSGDKNFMGYIFSLLPVAVGVTGWVIVIVNHQQITTFMHIFWAYFGLVVYTIAAIGFTIHFLKESVSYSTTILTIAGVIGGLLLGLTSSLNLKPNFEIDDKVVLKAYSKEENTIYFYIENNTALEIQYANISFNISVGSTFNQLFKGDMVFSNKIQAGSYVKFISVFIATVFPCRR